MKHIEFLVEDSSGKEFLELLLLRVIADHSTYLVHAYKGIGHIPRGLRPGSDASKRILLDQLPRLLKGYGKAFAQDPEDYQRYVFVICDLDSRDFNEFLADLQRVVEQVDPSPNTTICLAIEEGEAWLLSDKDAVVAAYPRVNRADLDKYVPDSICGTWELLAELVEQGGVKSLQGGGYHEVGSAKHRWAKVITPHIDIERNRSGSFRYLIENLRDRLGISDRTLS